MDEIEHAPDRRNLVARALVIIASVALVLPIVALAGRTAWASASERAARLPFESGAWRADTAYDVDVPRTVRLRMVDDLLRRRLLEGRTRAELTDLLGTPPGQPVHRDEELVYYLGPERHVLSDHTEWLVIRFGRDGRAVGAKIVLD